MDVATQQYFQITARHHLLLAALDAIRDAEARAQIEAAVLADTRRRMRGAANGHAARNPPAFRTLLACRASANGNGFEREHAVPLNLLHNALLGLANAPAGGLQVPVSTQEQVGQFLQSHLLYVLVTREEHAQLNAFNMPEGWQWHMDPMARYIEAGIAFHSPGGCVHCGCALGDEPAAAEE